MALETINFAGYDVKVAKRENDDVMYFSVEDVKKIVGEKVLEDDRNTYMDIAEAKNYLLANNEEVFEEMLHLSPNAGVGLLKLV